MTVQKVWVMQETASSKGVRRMVGKRMQMLRQFFEDLSTAYTPDEKRSGKEDHANTTN